MPSSEDRLCGACSASGLILALTITFAHALWNDAVASTIAFVFEIPLMIRPYRTLPAKISAFLPSLIALGLLLVAGGKAYWTARQTRSGSAGLGELFVLSSAPISLLPYAFGRADYNHFLPLMLMLAGALGIAAIIWKETVSRTLCVLGLLVVAWPLLRPVKNIPLLLAERPVCTKFERVLAQSTDDCISLIPSGTRSLFVGQQSYDRFLVNFPILYLVRPDLRPATRFISDEPGLQTRCDRGEEIAADLARTPRPLILFLDLHQSDEPNLTRNMQSCGRIERTIQSFPTVDLGTCRLHGHTMRVLLHAK